MDSIEELENVLNCSVKDLVGKKVYVSNFSDPDIVGEFVGIMLDEIWGWFCCVRDNSRGDYEIESYHPSRIRIDNAQYF